MCFTDIPTRLGLNVHVEDLYRCLQDAHWCLQRQIKAIFIQRQYVVTLLQRQYVGKYFLSSTVHASHDNSFTVLLISFKQLSFFSQFIFAIIKFVYFYLSQVFHSYPRFSSIVVCSCVICRNCQEFCTCFYCIFSLFINGWEDELACLFILNTSYGWFSFMQC